MSADNHIDYDVFGDEEERGRVVDEKAQQVYM
jgi:hypothetical protein